MAFAYKTEDGARFFIKYDQNQAAGEHFRNEWVGSVALTEAGLRIPASLGMDWVDPGHPAKGAWMIQEHVDLVPHFDDDAERAVGQQLAALHHASRHMGERRFGFHLDNQICNALLQSNSWLPEWHDFFIQRRLCPQLELARAQFPEVYAKGQALIGSPELFERFFSGRWVVPTLLHGELWRGNVALDASGDVVFFDPAPYWGDALMDLALTLLYDGLGDAFLASYYEAMGDEAANEDLLELYALYHRLASLNHFGADQYLGSCIGILDRLLMVVGIFELQPPHGKRK